ncbi:GDSL esterase/lipase At1g29660 [Selaginella moellendorffii]|nr:GDSL esterase/lipase At1g29660 [Selaginella moellendorffii]|eukprot:XP_002985252.2 GDSL esterase/lipase At1g29660 [Selaginella moellendorffii]
MMMMKKLVVLILIALCLSSFCDARKAHNGRKSRHHHRGHGSRLVGHHHHHPPPSPAPSPSQAPPPGPPCKNASAGVQGLFVFGDSIVDPGNNNNRNTPAKANHLPYGFKWSGHEASGRFCDGKLAVDLVAEHLGLPYPPPYSSDASAAAQGMNFGSASSGILTSTGQVWKSIVIFSIAVEHWWFSWQGSILTLPDQVDLFTQVAKGLSADVISNSIFYISTGNNDMMSISSTASIISQFQTQLERLYNAGARKFVVVGILDVGCVPATQVNDKCTDLGKSMTQKFNSQLQAMLQSMQQAHQGFTPVYANAASIMEEAIADPSSVGLSNVHQGCCPGTGNSMQWCYANAPHCANSGEYMFWDLVHPTEAFNTIAAQRWYNGGTQYVTPMSISALAAA